MELHVARKELLAETGPNVLDEPSAIRGLLDDVLDEDSGALVT